VEALGRIIIRGPYPPSNAIYSSLFVKKNDSIGKIQKNVTKLQKKQIKKLK